MGLDITAWETATATGECHPVKADGVPEAWCEDEDVVQAFVYTGFERSLDGLEAGACYRVEGKSLRFRAGSYTGYGAWRDDLARTMLGVSVQGVADTPSAYADKPFFELIWFADNEGTIGPAAAARLAEDFTGHAAEYRLKHAGAEPWMYVDKYEEWSAAFALAADTGLVQFR